MQIMWDEPKRQATLDLRGLDFADLTPEFSAGALVRPIKQRRLMAIGWLDARSYAVVFMPIGRDALSVVSMRPTSKKERTLL